MKAIIAKCVIIKTKTKTMKLNQLNRRKSAGSATTQKGRRDSLLSLSFLYIFQSVVYVTYVW